MMGIYSNTYMNESFKKPKDISIKSEVNDILMKGKSKSDIVAKLKAMEKKYDNKENYNKKDTLNSLITCCFAIPAIVGTGGTVLSSTALGGTALVGIPVGLVGLYLSGLLHEKNLRMYDKEAMLKHTMSSVQKRADSLEKASKSEKNSKKKQELDKRLKDANATIKYCDKQLHNIKRAKEDIESKDDSSNDDFDFDFDIDLDDTFDDWSLESAIIETKVEKGNALPVFIVLVEGGSIISKSIKTFTSSVYSHAALSFDSTLKNIYSFNMNKDDVISHNNKGGISSESIDKYIDDNRKGRLKVLTIFLNVTDFNKLKERLDYFVENSKETSYSILSLFDIAFNKGKDKVNNMSMVCSQFVDSIFKTINIDLTNKQSNLVTPATFDKLTNTKIYKVYDGDIIGYDSEKVNRRLGKLFGKAEYIKEDGIIFYDAEPITETKELPIRFDNEGDIILKNPKRIDFKAEHAKSKKLYPTLKKHENIEGMKYEACKLWYMNVIILKRIEKEKNKDKRDELLDIRSKILNEFSLYINQINKLDNTFNFETYYQSTPFGENEIKISGSTIQHSTNLFKLILK